MKLHAFMTTPELAGAEFSGPSWSTWRVIARLIDGDAALLTAAEQALALKLTGRTKPPTKAPSEVYIGAGRRGGKSRFISLVSTWLVARDYPQLSPGETAIVAHVAPDRRQASIDLDYARGIVTASAMLRDELIGDTASALTFKHRTQLEVAAASYRTVRGRTLCGAVIDESAFLRSDDSALPDVELARALRPALLTLNGIMLVISSPHRKVGLLYDAHRRFYGNDEQDRGLFIQASSRELNPLLDEEAIAEAMADDPAAAQSEYLGLFRADLQGFLDDATVDAAIVAGRRMLPRVEGCQYQAFCDPSGGRSDSFALAVAHQDPKTDHVVLDALEVIAPPFEPETAVQRMVATLALYGLNVVTGDRYAGEWVSATFRKFGVRYEASELSKSLVYLEALPLFMQGRVELLDSPLLRTQLLLLERRAHSGGADGVDHPRGAHDDGANATAGALVQVGSNTGLAVWMALGRGTLTLPAEPTTIAAIAPTSVSAPQSGDPAPDPVSVQPPQEQSFDTSQRPIGGVDIEGMRRRNAEQRQRAAAELQARIEYDNARERAALAERERRMELELQAGGVA